jgi:Fe-S cluster assembly protein SufD
MTNILTQPIHGVTAAFSEDAVFARSAGEPSWLADQRREAWEIYASLPVPTTRLEEWRYTDPKLLAWDKVALAQPDSNESLARAQALLDGKDASGRALQIGASVASVQLDPEVRKKGVVFMDLASAAEEHADLVRAHLGTRALPLDASKFGALNSALWSGGLFLYVPRGVRLERPIRVVRWIEQPGLAYLPRTLVVAGEGSEVPFVEEFASPDLDKPAFVCAAAEVIAGAASRVQYVSLQRFGKGVRHLAIQRTIAQRDASLDTMVVNLGGTVARVDLGASFEGAGARSDMLGLYFGRNDQHFDHETRQDHRVSHASSDLLYKGALTDKSTAVFRGLIKVYPKAQRTDAYQTNRNLILSKHAQATSLPNLEIEADDVRCSHAATVGHLDEEELYYIMSRGIPRKEAERLVVFGFFGDVLERLPLPDVVRELRHAIEERIG